MVTDSRIASFRQDEGSGLERLGVWLLRLSLVLIFLSIGLQKFTAYEAAAIAPFVVNSPLLSWAYALLGERGVAAMLGVIELSIGAALAVGFFAQGSRLALLGAAGSALTYVVTLSFLLTTPGVIVFREGMPLSSPILDSS